MIRRVGLVRLGRGRSLSSWLTQLSVSSRRRDRGVPFDGGSRGFPGRLGGVDRYGGAASGSPEREGFDLRSARSIELFVAAQYGGLLQRGRGRKGRRTRPRRL